MSIRQNAERELKEARDTFWFALGAYALLTEEPSRSQVSQYAITVEESGVVAVSPKGQAPSTSVTGYVIGFNAGLADQAALSVVEFAFRQMLVKTFDIAKVFAKSKNLDIGLEPWFHFARHYRNAIAHNGKWNFTSNHGLPTTWRNRSLTSAMHGSSIDGFLTWFEGLQLGAQINIFVSTSCT